jgi:molecular chaperone DnaK (HSP70)
VVQPENPSIIVQFPDADGSMEGASSEEVPTELAYTSDGADYKWGFQATGTEDRFVCFKLGLNPLREREASYLSIMYPDHTGLPPNDDHPAPDLSRDYIKKVRQHVIKILESKLGDVVVNTTPIEWILTVPAIWEDGAKANTKSCAVAAGIREKIHMISEPEAAMTYVLDAMDPDTLQVGDTFVCADCGGGTVDLISYTIEDLGAKVKIIEAAEGTGDLCGSSFVNRVFRKWFTDRFSGHEGYGEDTLEAAMERFETITKRKFSGGPENFILPVPGLVDDPIKRVRRQRLTMTLADLTAVFEVVVPVVTSLVTAQIKKTAKPIKAVLMVGGFGQSPYLREMIKKVVGPKVTVIQPANASTAVVRGALTTALAITTPGSSRIEVLSRVARKCYGIEYDVPFNHKRDLRSRRFVQLFPEQHKVTK